MSSYYVFGFTRADTVPPPVDDSELEIVFRASSQVAAAVAEMGAARVDPGRLLLAHHGVLARMLQHGPVVPLKPGLVLPSAQDVDDLIAREQQRIENLLSVFSNHIEANVRAYYHEEAVLREIADANPDVRVKGAGYVERVRVGERIADSLERTRRSDAGRFIAALRAHAEQVALHAPTHYTAFNTSFLLKRDALPGFERALANWGESQRLRLRLKLIAPLPPYSFVTT